MLYSRGEGRYNKEYEELWHSLVPDSFQANTVQGELVRVIGRLASEYYRNGNGNWDMGFRIYTNFLLKHLRDESVFDAQMLLEIEDDIQEIRSYGSGNDFEPKATPAEKRSHYLRGEDVFDRVTDRVVEWCRAHPELISHQKNPKLKR